MATLEGLRRKVESTEDLQSVVRTMKALAAVNIRQYEEAANALGDYRRTTELGLRVVLGHARPRRAHALRRQHVGAAIVIGSDQGMCGQFNEDVSRHADSRLSEATTDDVKEWRILAVGERLTPSLTSHGRSIAEMRNVPGSAGAITAHVRAILGIIERWQSQLGDLRQVLLIYNQYAQQDTMPVDRRVLPMDEDWLHQLHEKPWPTRTLPMFRASADALLSHLVRQYLFAELYGALANSLAAENSTRLRAMQSAEKNVDERLDELTTRYNRQRQNSITAELLDVISGSEAVAT